MNNRSTRRALLLTISLLAGVSGAARAEPVYLNCPAAGTPADLALGFYLTVDYGTNTVTVSRRDTLAPLEDHQGHTSQPAKVTDNEIAWRLQGYSDRGANYRLDRFTGRLLVFNDGDRGIGGRFDCDVVSRLEKPKPKF